MKGQESKAGGAPEKTFSLGCAIALLSLGIFLPEPWAALRAETISEAPAGLVVEQIRRGSTADKAGLQDGDNLLSWSREAPAPVQGIFRSPFDWRSVLIEQVPRGKVTLVGRRGEAERTWVLPAGSPSGGDQTEDEVTVRPALTSDLLALYSAGKERVAQGDLEGGVERWRSATAQALARGETEIALWLRARQARAFAEAERWLEADSIYEELIEPLEASGSADPRAAQLLREWGRLWIQRRIWYRAEDCYRRALAVARKIDPQGLAAAWSLNDLGDLATQSGGALEPDPFFQEALAIRQRLAPGSSDVASSFRYLGTEALTDGDYQAAEKNFQKALAIQERATPDLLYVAERLLAVAAVKYFQKDFPASEKLYERALAITEREAPEDLGILGILQGIGAAATGRGDWRKAETALLRAVHLGEKLAPANLNQLHVLLYELGQAQRRLGKRQASTDHLCRALRILEQRRKKFASNQELQLSWSFRFAERYWACARGLVEAGRQGEAFEVLERGRARSFLHLLTERDLRLSELPLDQATEWGRLTADYNLTQNRLEQARVEKAEPHRLWSLEGRLREIRRAKERILAESLPLSILQHPDPLGLEGVRQALDPGTALLFYAVGQEQTLLFVVKPEGQGAAGFAAFSLPVNGKDLEERVDTFRDTLINDRFNSQTLNAQARRLYSDLLQPAEAFLEGIQRFLIVPDGPLHTLPFAALVRQGQYLVEWKPLHFAVSVTAYAQLQKRRRPLEEPAHRKLAAFGDPLFRQTSPGTGRDSTARSVKSPQSGFAPLPASRAEVEEIARLFPHARVFLQAEATEENAKKVSNDVRWLHFAVHGLLNERIPINSALVLSASPGGVQEPGNGLLQAWEIMEDLRLDADLVTLSACDTALGTQVGGEGLIGLTRAFQYAGARSVLATLWGITDSSTVPWMKRFYRELRDGKTKDEALRAAQIEQIRSANGPYPFYWAAFQLYGDWK